jgi:transposase InsO family protein
MSQLIAFADVHGLDAGRRVAINAVLVDGASLIRSRGYGRRPNDDQRVHRKRPGDDVDGRIRSARVIEVLSQLVNAHGAPIFQRSDTGPDFVSKALLSGSSGRRTGTGLIDPGKRWQNGVTGAFHGKLRNECLSLEWFRHRRR